MNNGVSNNKVYVVGHKNPDTDSICSAIAYADLKSKITGEDYSPRRAGQLNEETQYVLDHFQVEAPKLLSDLRVQVKDVELRNIEGIKGSVSIKSAWKSMKELNIKTLPVTRDSKLEGLITIGDIATSYMDVYDSGILSKARTQYRNIASTIDGTIIAGNPHSYVLNGKVGILASSRKLMSEFVEENDLVILGDGQEAQQHAVDLNVSCMVVCNGARVGEEILKQAEEKEIVIISSPHDAFTVARLINQSIPVKQFMTREGIVSFQMDDYVDDVKDVMARRRFRDFPILDEAGNFLGFISRRRLLNSRRKQVILVDHNEKSQAVDGIEEAEIMEIIDHHRLGSIETMGPVFFRNQPLGCTSTIVYQMYCESGIEIEEKIAGLLLSAILSDTLMFRSPTCTKADHEAARALAAIAKVDIVDLADRMFRAGCDFASKTVDEIFYQDFKTFHAGDTAFGVAQISAVSREELSGIKEKIHDYMNQVMSDKKVDMVFVMLTDILNESTELLCCGKDAVELATGAYHLPADDYSLMLPGVVSRKKQLIPSLITAMQQEDQ